MQVFLFKYIFDKKRFYQVQGNVIEATLLYQYTSMLLLLDLRISLPHMNENPVSI